jgi:DNA primase
MSSGRIPRTFLDDLLNRVDIVEIIDARVPLKKKGREYWACCPFHNEKSPSFSVSQRKQFYHCFGCQQNGNAIGFLMDYDHMDFVEAIETLAQHVGVEIPYEQGQAPDPRKKAESESLFATLQQCSDYYRGQLKNSSEAIDYLKNRGISGDIAARYAIGFAPPGWNNLSSDEKNLEASGMLVRNDQGRVYDRFRHRLMFPIRDRRGRTIAFGGRVVNPADNPKYLNSPESPVFHKGEEIYGLYEARKASNQIDTLFVTEGYMDVVSLAEHGVSSAVATLGTAINQRQIEGLFRVCSHLVFCFDGDLAGRKAAWRALENSLESLKEGRIARFLFLPEGQDPDTYIQQHGLETFQREAANATTLGEFLLDELLARGETASPEGRSHLVDSLRPYFEKIPLQSLKDELLRRIEKRLNIEIDTRMLQVLGQQGQQRRSPTPVPQQQWTPVRLCINLLLHKPELAALVGNLEEMAQTDIPGVDLLLSVIDRIQEEPGISTPNLLARFAGDPHEQHLYTIAARTPPMQDDDSDMQPMLEDALYQLRQQYRKARYQSLKQKMDQGQDLSESEMEEFLQLPAMR